MKFKFLLLILTFVLFIDISLASFEVTPNQINLDLIVNNEVKFNLTIFNNYNFSFYNVQLESSSYISSTIIEELQAQEEKVIEVTVLTDSPVSTILSPTLFGHFLSELQHEPESHFVNILHNSFEPNSINIYSGSSITFRNADEIQISHTLLCPPYINSQAIPPDGTFTQLFNNIEIVNCCDDTFGFCIEIKVQNKSYYDFTRNTDYDFTGINIMLDSDYYQTEILFELIDKNFTIEYNKIKEGLLRIYNTGNETARNISLTASKWIIFDENNFWINEGDQNYIQYLIIPIIAYSNSTNKSYSISLTAKGINTPSITKNIDIFIPYKELEIEDYSREEFLEKLVADLLTELSQYNLTRNQTVEIIYKEVTLGYNFTERQLDNYFTKQVELSDEQKRLTQANIPVADYILNVLPDVLKNIISISNDTAEMSKETRNKVEFRNFLEGLIALIFIIIAGSIIWLYFKNKRDMQEANLG